MLGCQRRTESWPSGRSNSRLVVGLIDTRRGPPRGPLHISAARLDQLSRISPVSGSTASTVHPASNITRPLGVECFRRIEVAVKPGCGCDESFAQRAGGRSEPLTLVRTNGKVSNDRRGRACAHLRTNSSALAVWGRTCVANSSSMIPTVGAPGCFTPLLRCSSRASWSWWSEPGGSARRNRETALAGRQAEGQGTGSSSSRCCRAR